MPSPLKKIEKPANALFLLVQNKDIFCTKELIVLYRRMHSFVQGFITLKRDIKIRKTELQFTLRNTKPKLTI